MRYSGELYHFFTTLFTERALYKIKVILKDLKYRLGKETAIRRAVNLINQAFFQTSKFYCETYLRFKEKNYSLITTHSDHFSLGVPGSFSLLYRISTRGHHYV